VSKVLVTGGSGFIGSHAILQLLAAGHQVRTTVRSLKRKDDVLEMLRVGGAAQAVQAEQGGDLEFATASLEDDSGWPEAVAGCDFVLHVASPFPPKVPKDENELIVRRGKERCGCFGHRATRA
jgi:dihydroflavonol-4-reductase